MMRFLFIFLLPLSCFGQNLSNENGLPVGWWVNKIYNNADSLTIDSAFYIVTDIKNFIPTYDLDSNQIDMFYKRKLGSEEFYLLVDPEHVKNGKVSVKHGMAKSYYDGGQLISMSKYSFGVRIWSNDYNKNGEIEARSYIDTSSGITYSDSYKEGKIFRRNYYNDSFNKTIYYPQEKMQISDAELLFSVNLLNKPSDTVQTILYANSSIEINEIELPPAFFILDSACGVLKFPFILEQGKELKFNIIYKPTAASGTSLEPEFIKFYTSDSLNPLYQLFCMTESFHVDGSNIEGIDILKLSRSKDKVIYFGSFGTQSHIAISPIKNKHTKPGFTDTDPVVKSDYYGSYHNGLNFSELKTGKYYCTITSCHTGYIIVLEIVE